MDSTSEASGAGTVKKRRRPAVSCEQCRQRKVKCDLEEPCGPCSRARATLTCSYSAYTVRDVPTQKRPPRAEPPRSGHDSRPHRPPSGDSVPLSPTLASRVDTEEVQQQPRQNSGSGSHSHSTDAPIGRSASQADVTGNQEGTRAAARRPPPSPFPLRLRLGPEKSRFFGHAHWLHTADKLHGMEYDNQSMQPLGPNVGADVVTTIQQLGKVRRAIKARDSIVLNEPIPNLHTSLPTRNICDELCDAYFRTYEGIYRIFHVPTFWREYFAFWERPSMTTFCTKLCLVLALGATFFPIERTEHRRLRRLARVWIYAAQWWLSGPSEKSTLNVSGVQIACLLQLARQVTGLGSSTCYGDQALRLALDTGLHRDPDHFAALTPLQKQTRRSLWVSVLEISLQCSLGSPLPSPCHVSYDTRPPANINDKDIDDKNAPIARPDDHFTDTSLQRLLARSLPARLRAGLLISNQGFLSEQDYDDPSNVNSLASEIKLALHEVSNVIALDCAAVTESSQRTLRPTIFHHHYADIQFRRLIVMLHRPFFLSAPSDPSHAYSRKSCLEAALVIASYAYKLKLPEPPSEDIARFMSAVRNSTNSPMSLDITFILGLEILTQIEESGPAPEAAQDVATSVIRATREPLYRIVDHIRQQLFEIISSGSTSVKRYGYLCAMTSKLRALERGISPQHASIEAVSSAIKAVMPLLERALEQSPPQEDIRSLTSSQFPSSDMVAAADGLDGFPSISDGLEDLNFDYSNFDSFFGIPNFLSALPADDDTGSGGVS